MIFWCGNLAMAFPWHRHVLSKSACKIPKEKTSFLSLSCGRCGLCGVANHGERIQVFVSLEIISLSNLFPGPRHRANPGRALLRRSIPGHGGNDSATFFTIGAAPLSAHRTLNQPNRLNCQPYGSPHSVRPGLLHRVGLA